MKIYTKKGDLGETSLLGGKRVSKANLRIESYGTVDELNSNLGLLRAQWDNEEDDSILESIQNQLFNLGSLLAMGPSKTQINLPKISQENIDALETRIDEMEVHLEPLKNFVLPGGSVASAQAHVCRCVCRRAERLCVDLHSQEELDPILVAYLNRLSDFFFVLARKILSDQGLPDHPWSYLKP